MKIKTNVLTYDNGPNNPKSRAISYKCDKCNAVGFVDVSLDQEDLTDEQKKCCD